MIIPNSQDRLEEKSRCEIGQSSDGIKERQQIHTLHSKNLQNFQSVATMKLTVANIEQWQKSKENASE